jgi:nitroimidazol reductase NimA-like FMN-containing flavoprotein (pyridoxamine 5'-phosphate oxidase superfamily)
VTAGLPLSTKYIQSEQSVVGKGYSEFVVNNIAEHGEKDKLVDVLSLGPINKPARGVERIDWEPVKHQWKSAWTNATAVSISMMPTMGGTSNRGNGGHAQPQLFPNGDLLCNSIGGPIRVRNQ